MSISKSSWLNLQEMSKLQHSKSLSRAAVLLTEPVPLEGSSTRTFHDCSGAGLSEHTWALYALAATALQWTKLTSSYMMPMQTRAIDTTRLWVDMICACGASASVTNSSLDYPLLPVHHVPVIPRTFLLVMFIWLSQLFPYVTMPSDLTGSLLGIPNYDHVCVILDAPGCSWDQQACF